ncbi:hypothetical protein Q9Q94_06940 [Uliginosibacterium sp. 31-16]|uniref:hypothetical protein n=1 Tax=Uliginosibacterium sp. 31-16 TaxID=3068315 RepID=UPI00273F0D31|nr:hypothetical protein [Uliginosibacterium sp. 31-16]MDP5239258.1 hypothetical protein [Uliginosibacterium sp. 31-16]
MCILLSGVFLGWVKSEHSPEEAVQVASSFLKMLEESHFSQAFELSVKQGYVGDSPEALQAISARELCKVDRLVSTSPFQSNGNRLRRLVMGRDVEMPQIQVEFSGACLLGVTLRRTARNEWRVYRFARHAG